MSDSTKITCSPIPCTTCPYRRDVASGVWHEDEYQKLLAYDRPTSEQPPALFMCHQQTGGLCTGWLQSHADRDHRFDLLALRINYRKFDESVAKIAVSDPEVLLFKTAAAAAAHGMKEIEKPGRKAKAAIARIVRKRERAGESDLAAAKAAEEK